MADGFSRATVSSAIRRQSMHIGKSLAGSVGSYLPGVVTEIFEPSRDFAYLKLPSAGVQSVIALSKYVLLCIDCMTFLYFFFLASVRYSNQTFHVFSTTPQVMVATSDGYLYQYNIDLENGGPCVLLKQYSLLESTEDFAGSPGSEGL